MDSFLQLVVIGALRAPLGTRNRLPKKINVLGVLLAHTATVTDNNATHVLVVHIVRNTQRCAHYVLLAKLEQALRKLQNQTIA